MIEVIVSNTITEQNNFTISDISKTIKAAHWTALTHIIWFVVITTGDQQQPMTYPPRYL
jgi:hypothetical protein